MKILILGNSRSFWIKEYIENVLLKDEKEKHQIHVTVKNGGKYDEFYKANGITAIDIGRKNPGVPGSRLNTVINLLKFSFSVKNNEFDAIHVHYVPNNLMSQFYAHFLLNKGRKVICSFWGSDILREGVKGAKRQKSCLDKANCITYASDAVKEKVSYFFPGKYENKLRKVKFGLSAFSYIDAVRKGRSKEELKKELGAPCGKTLVGIGYNESEGQQHLKVLEALAGAGRDVLDKITLLYHFGVSRTSEKYKDKVIAKTEELKIDHIVINGFLDKEQVAVLRCAVDIFIHAQISDAFSASVCEYLYSGASVLNPSWIKYPELDRYGAVYAKYDRFEELPKLLAGILHAPLKTEKNRKVLSCLAGWEGRRMEWLSLYYNEGENIE